jgi:hypothetical protein
MITNVISLGEELWTQPQGSITSSAVSVGFKRASSPAQYIEASPGRRSKRPSRFPPAGSPLMNSGNNVESDSEHRQSSRSNSPDAFSMTATLLKRLEDGRDLYRED